jgi:hypothetical protein
MNLNEKINSESFFWLNRPASFKLADGELSLTTEPYTDLWQQTYYGFINDNAPAFLTTLKGNFSFSVKTEFGESNFLYDQCGLLLYLDSDNWLKVSGEYENEKFSRLGSVATNLGYSDWATTDISSRESVMWYRLSRRNQDFYVENSVDGITYRQMRMLHLHKSSETVNVGVYACSPLNSSFTARFSDFKITDCQWPEYKNE